MAFFSQIIKNNNVNSWIGAAGEVSRAYCLEPCGVPHAVTHSGSSKEMQIISRSVFLMNASHPFRPFQRTP